MIDVLASTIVVLFFIGLIVGLWHFIDWLTRP
jgi:hypothetical protein